MLFSRWRSPTEAETPPRASAKSRVLLFRLLMRVEPQAMP